jgi:hypothetical protein
MAMSSELSFWKFFVNRQHSFMKMKYFGVNSIFHNGNSLENDRKLFFWAGYHHIHVYWPQFSEFIEITSPSKSKSAQGRS